MDNASSKQHEKGDVVYVVYRNPHTQNVAQVSRAAVVDDPEEPGQLSLFMYDTYYPLTGDLAVFDTEFAAEEAYEAAFGSPDDEDDPHG